MLDSETKRRIDTARDILVGKVPDPKSQVEQITIALIYKFMDDMDAEAEELGGVRKFFTGDFARYGWVKLMSPKVGGHELITLYSDGVDKMSENPGIPLLFRDIFKNAYLPYRDPETLKSFLKIINEFTYDHSERLGDAFEYLLSILGSQGDAGQFRTPRHIIDFIVDLVEPKKGDVVLDPSCGTAGFLISAYKYILRTNKDAKNVNLLTPDEKGRLAKCFKGFDISPDMVRLSLVNLYLHGFSDPSICEYDTLSDESRWKEQADVILANPPFMTPKGGIRPHNLFSIMSKRSEVLFLDYIIEHLTSKGRAGVIVPEGIHFVAQAGHTKLRRTLIENNLLLADITLPHGVFKPYASVKTHVLIIDKVLAKLSNSVLFIEIENDGFKQSDTRESVHGSQLDLAISDVKNFKESIKTQVKWKKSNSDLRAYTILKSKLLVDPNAHLLGRWYDLENRVLHKKNIPLRLIGDICAIKDGLSPNLATKPGEYVMVIPAKSRKTADHYDFEGKAVCIPLVSSAGHGKADIKRIHYQEGKFALAKTMCALFVKDESIIRAKYLYIYLNSMSQELLVPLMCGATNVTMNSKQLAGVIIPVPEIKYQDDIIESDLITKKVALIKQEALSLKDSSLNKKTIKLAEQLLYDINVLLEGIKDYTKIDEFISL